MKTFFSVASLLLWVACASALQIGPNTNEEQKKHWRAAFAVGRQMLIEKGVPFDPDELLHDGWPKRLAPVFETMPEMHQTIRAGQFLEGVVMADTLYIPQTARFKGNTLLLVRHIVFEGTTANLKSAPSTDGKPGGIYLYPLAPKVVMDMSLEQAMAKAGLVQQGTKEDPVWPSYSEIRSVIVEKPHTITIDNSGQPGKPDEPQKKPSPPPR